MRQQIYKTPALIFPEKREVDAVCQTLLFARICANLRVKDQLHMNTRALRERGSTYIAERCCRIVSISKAMTETFATSPGLGSPSPETTSEDIPIDAFRR